MTASKGSEIIQRMMIAVGAHKQEELAIALGVRSATLSPYKKLDRVPHSWIQTLREKHGISPDFLLTGEGPMLSVEVEAKNSPSAPVAQPIPVVGLVSCGVDGWEQATPSALSASTPVFGAHWLAAIAFGDSMTPAGIHPGHICYCDPEQIPLAGDAVYVIRKDGLATIKAFVGPSETGPEWTRLKGWTPANGSGFRREFFIDLLTKDVEKIAPVIYVRRRI